MDTVSISDEAMRRAMIADGFDPTDPEQRTAYANTLRGSGVRINAEFDSIGRQITAPIHALLDGMTRGSDPR